MGTWNALTGDERRWVRKLVRRGCSYREIAAEIGRSQGAVGVIIRDELGGGRLTLVEWCPGPGRLSLSEREEIHLGLERGASLSEIARRLGRSTSTVSREVKVNGGRVVYRASKAHRRAFEAARRPKHPSWVDTLCSERSSKSGSRSGGRPSRSAAACNPSSPTIR